MMQRYRIISIHSPLLLINPHLTHSTLMSPAMYIIVLEPLFSSAMTKSDSVPESDVLAKLLM